MSIKQIDIKKLIPYIKKSWTPIIIGKVDSHDIKLVEFKGEYFWHKHEKHDEFLLVLKGAISIDFKNGKEIELKAFQGVSLEKGTMHRSKAKRKSLVLVVQGEAIDNDIVKND